MDLGIKGKVAIVTASSKGIGKAVAKGLAREGAAVMICARRKEALEETREEIAGETGAEVLARRADVRIPYEVRALVKEVVSKKGRIDILVTNAGGPPFASFLELDESLWDETYQQTLLSVVRLVKEVVPHMKKIGKGRIINLTSATVRQPIEGLVLSNALRAAVSGLSKTLSNELAKDNILVNCVAPGFTETERMIELANARAKALGKTLDDVLKGYKSSVPLGRFAKPDEIANAVVFLSSEKASFITGVTLLVDGGHVKAL